jgi:hypothetical protein
MLLLDFMGCYKDNEKAASSDAYVSRSLENTRFSGCASLGSQTEHHNPGDESPNERCISPGSTRATMIAREEVSDLLITKQSTDRK